MSLYREFGDALKGVWSLLVGLRVTGAEFAKKQVTVHYPRQVVDNITTFRGHIELVGKPKDPAVPKCISCMMCQSVCPSGCIIVKKSPKIKPTEEELRAAEEAGKPAPKPKAVKTPKGLLLDYNLCSLCGLCVQNCPVGSLRFSTDVYLAGFERKDFEYDLVKRLKEQAAQAASSSDAPASSSKREAS